jgi:hypothetical protein
MRPIFSSVLAVLAGAFVASACYSEREPPPSFRYACDADGDCADGQSCIDGLCETPCTAETFAEVCIRGEALCLNGVCSSTCDLAKDTCPSAQECFDLGIDLGGGGGGFLSSGSSDTAVGICIRACSADSCADAETCIEGICVATCTTDVQCGSGLTCQLGLCLPEASTSSGTDASSGDPTDNPTFDPSTTSSSDGGDSSSSGGTGETGGGT